ncbi:putative Ankyrin repeat family protein [Hibiscus syriacus]|uniref:Ankyrin repeat family protein n=1 Tax=Hibiscus syriacus TaxID=106335 RepID=A0A6A2WQZ7_HIBSY|nr:putative Ankyrin repeat family protein [Hibiscus syriacus]
MRSSLPTLRYTSLNQQGLSPIHLAIRKRHTEMALRFLEIDKHLVRVRGKKGKTPLHCISKVGNADGVLDRFLEACPECIRDVTTGNRTALHIAVENDGLDVLRVLLRSLRKKDYCRQVIGWKDENGNTVLHVAASSNQTQVRPIVSNN